jgi:hypothetical protein
MFRRRMTAVLIRIGGLWCLMPLVARMGIGLGSRLLRRLRRMMTRVRVDGGRAVPAVLAESRRGE